MTIAHGSRVLCVIGLVATGGCGGGGGGGDPTIPVVQAFTSWSAVQPNSTVTAQGMSQTTSANFTVAANGDVTVTSISPFSTVDTAASSATLSFGASRQLIALQINAPAGNVSWNTTVLGGGNIACGSGQCTATKDAGTSEAVLIDPYSAVGWNYQSFGVWQTGTNTSGTFGTTSFGAPTPVGGLPTVGGATYNGLAAGVYVAPGGALFGTSANMSATVTFQNRSVAFTTSNTSIATASGTVTPAPELNLSGTLTYPNGGTQFTGAVATPPGNPGFQLSGTATGRFYGPAAQEIGGVYSLTGTGLQSMGGGFGGKQ